MALIDKRNAAIINKPVHLIDTRLSKKPTIQQAIPTTPPSSTLLERLKKRLIIPTPPKQKENLDIFKRAVGARTTKLLAQLGALTGRTGGAQVLGKRFPQARIPTLRETRPELEAIKQKVLPPQPTKIQRGIAATGGLLPDLATFLVPGMVEEKAVAGALKGLKATKAARLLQSLRKAKLLTPKLTQQILTKSPTLVEKTLSRIAGAGAGGAAFGLQKALLEQKPAKETFKETAKMAAEFAPFGLLTPLGTKLAESKLAKKILKTPSILERIRKPEIKPIPKELEPLAKEARKYKSAEEFVKKSGIVPEWGAQNQWYRKNPLREQLEKMKLTGKYDQKVIAQADMWEMKQVLKDKPAYLNDGLLSDKIVKDFAKKNRLFIDKTSDGKLVIGKTKAIVDKVIHAKTQRELGLALGYKDIGIMGGGKSRLAKQQLKDFYNQATKGIKELKVKPTAEKIMQELKQARQKATQAGFIKTPSKKISAEQLEKAGVTIEKQAQKPVLTFITPIRELAKKEAPAGEIARIGRRVYSKYEEASIEGNQRLQQMWKGISLPEKEKLVELQEKGISEKVINQLPKKYQRAINGLRWFNKEIEKIAKKEFGVDTSKWSYDAKNYFHHLFLGDQSLMIDGRIKKIGKYNEILVEADRLIKQGTPPASIEIGPKFKQGNVPTTLLSRKGFWAFINKMAKQLKISGDEVLSEIQGVAAIKPRPTFVGAFKRRRANLEGYLKDPELVYKILWDRIQRKRYLEPAGKEMTNLLSKIKTPWLKKEMETYIEGVKGKYIDPLYWAGINVSKLAQKVTKYQSLLKLGYRPSSAFLNRLQPLQTSYSELGNYYIKGEGLHLMPRGKQILEKINLDVTRPKFTVGEVFSERGAGREKIYQPLGLFSREERKNRQVTALGAYLKGIEKLKLSEKEAIEYAKNMVDATQFRYDISDLATVLRHPIAKMFLQFKNFPINFAVNAKNTLTGQPLGGLEKYGTLSTGEKIARASRFLGTNFAIGGLRTILGLATPANLGFLTYLAVKHPKAFQGALSYLGIDMSARAGASPFEIIPKALGDALGPISGDFQRLYRAVKRYKKTKDYRDLLKIIAISPAAWDVYKAFESDKEETKIKLTPYERGLIGAGFKPVRISTTYDVMNLLRYYKPELRTKALGLPTTRALQNMAYNLQKRKNYDNKKKEAIRRLFETYNISKTEQNQLLREYKIRLKRSRKK